LVEGTRADGDDFAFLRLLLGGVGDDDAAGGLLILLDAADDHAVAKRAEFHGGFSSEFVRCFKRLMGEPALAAPALAALRISECQPDAGHIISGVLTVKGTPRPPAK